MPNARYITYGGNPVLSQPFAIRGVTGFGFTLHGDREKMQQLVDLTLNRAPHLRYLVATPTVLFTFMRMRDLRSTVVPDCDEGSLEENELNITLLLIAQEKTWFGWRTRRLAWYMPYLWLDSGPAMIAGRDVYGYPKQYGTITMPGKLGDPAQFCASGEVFSAFPPAAPSRVCPIFNVQRLDGATAELADPWDSIEEACRGFLREAFEADLPAIVKALAFSAIGPDHLLNLAFLRQLRSIAGGGRAAYQAVAEAPFEVTAFRGAGLLAGKYEIEMPKLASSPIAAELGFASDAAGHVRRPAELAYFLDFDFQLNCGREMWVAS